MRYAAQLATDTIPGDDPWEVVEVTPKGTRLYMAAGTEAQMQIYAFSLNAVVDGGILEALIPAGRAGDIGVAPPDAILYECRKYTGPTEGVAP